MAHLVSPTPLKAILARVAKAGLLAAVVGLAACGTIAKKPVIDVADVRIADFNRESAQFTVTLRVQNPNNIDIVITDIQAKLSVAETEIGSAEPAQSRYVITASSTVMLPVRVNIELKTLPEALRRSMVALVAGGVPYKIAGNVTTMNGLATVPFEKSGQIAKMR